MAAEGCRGITWGCCFFDSSPGNVCMAPEGPSV